MRFSLRIKVFLAFILISIILLLIAAVTTINYFEKDKKTYVFDLNLDSAISLSKEINTYIYTTAEQIRIITNFLERELTKENQDSQALKIIFNEYKDILAFFLYDGERIATQIYKKKFFQEHDIAIDQYRNKILREEILPLQEILNGTIFIANTTISPDFPSFLVAIPYEMKAVKKTYVVVAIVSSRKVLDWIRASTASESYVVDKKGSVLFHKDIEKVINQTDLSGLDIVGRLLSQESTEGSMEFVKGNSERFLGSYSFLPDTGLGVVVVRSYKDALIALAALRNKILNMVFYAFIISFLASVIFSRRLTSSLEKIMIGAAEIGKGNFSTIIEVKSQDEMGDLARNFNEMTVKLDQREKELRKTYEKLIQSERLSSCYMVGQKVSSILDLEKVFKMSVEYARELADVKASLLLLYDEGERELRGKAGDGLSSKEVKNFVLQPEGITDHSQTEWYKGLEHSESLKKMLKDKFSMKSYLAVPLMLFDRIYGLLILINKLTGKFSEHDYNLVYVFAAQCAIACENARLFKETEVRAVKDGLTGLYNRNYFAERTQEEFSLIKRYFRPLSFIVLDIDFFKKINDTYGHLIGDSVLQDISALLSGCVRNTDMVFRYGGEEFVAMLTGTSLDNAHFLAERLRKRVEGTKFKYDAEIVVPVTVSIGVASISEYDKEKIERGPQDLFKVADQALYRAKEGGRNRVECALIESVG